MRPKQKVTLKDIAEKLGVSVVTVSNSLAGRPGVSDEMRVKIRDAAISAGLDPEKYQKKKILSEVPEGMTAKSIGVLVSERYMHVGKSMYWEMYQKTAYVISRFKCFSSLIIVPDRSQKADPPEIKGLDGIIIIGHIRDVMLKKILNNARCTVVFLDEQTHMGDYSAVLSGNYYGMYKATRELVTAGHKEIGFVGALEYSGNIIDRYYGYKKCMRQNNLQVNPDYILSDRTGDDEEAKIVLPQKLPTAFACSSDYAASILYDALRERGLNVPGDISLVGYDNYLYGGEIEMILTTYNVDMLRMAERAVSQVLKEIKDPAASGEIIEIDSYIIRRESIKRCRNEK